MNQENLEINKRAAQNLELSKQNHKKQNFPEPSIPVEGLKIPASESEEPKVKETK